MKIKLLRRLRRKARREFGIVAEALSSREHEFAYYIGKRKELRDDHFQYLKYSYYRYAAEEHLYVLRRQHILSLVKDLRQTKARKQLKKLNRKLRRI